MGHVTVQKYIVMYNLKHYTPKLHQFSLFNSHTLCEMAGTVNLIKKKSYSTYVAAYSVSLHALFKFITHFSLPH